MAGKRGSTSLKTATCPDRTGPYRSTQLGAHECQRVSPRVASLPAAQRVGPPFSGSAPCSALLSGDLGRLRPIRGGELWCRRGGRLSLYECCSSALPATAAGTSRLRVALGRLENVGWRSFEHSFELLADDVAFHLFSCSVVVGPPWYFQHSEESLPVRAAPSSARAPCQYKDKSPSGGGDVSASCAASERRSAPQACISPNLRSFLSATNADWGWP